MLDFTVAVVMYPDVVISYAAEYAACPPVVVRGAFVRFAVAVAIMNASSGQARRPTVDGGILVRCFGFGPKADVFAAFSLDEA